MANKKELITDIGFLLITGPGLIGLFFLHQMFPNYMRYTGLIVGIIWTLIGVSFLLDSLIRRKQQAYMPLKPWLDDIKQKMERFSERKDIKLFLKKYIRGGYPTDTVKPVICLSCGADLFEAYYEDGNGTAAKCCACGHKHYLLDSEEHLSNEKIKFSCPKCNELPVHLWVGLSHRNTGDIKWVYVIFRCPKCHTLDCMLEWEINYGPTDETEKSLDKFRSFEAASEEK